jgi:pimeloyl-ACP methyl ester carboxylesterase
MVTLIRAGWAQENPAFRRMFASLFVPDATPEQVTWFDQLQRRTISPENAAAWQEKLSTIDATDLLKRVTASTLVLHGTKDGVTPFEGGREFAAGIPGARFVPLDSQNHILLQNEPAFAELLHEVTRFING